MNIKKIIIAAVIVLSLTAGSLFMTAHSLANTTSTASSHQSSSLTNVAQLTPAIYQPANTASPVSISTKTQKNQTSATSNQVTLGASQNNSPPNTSDPSNSNNSSNSNSKSSSSNSAQSNEVPPGATVICIDGVYKFVLSKDVCSQDGGPLKWLTSSVNLSL